jgi:glycosyltransferase involved in cell wall biosynthesis
MDRHAADKWARRGRRALPFCFMKFSIITPSFNQGRFLPDCVESVLSQAGVEVEHIVTDAGSTDETLEVLKRYPHLRWTSEPDGGMSDGINKGFLKATGDWVMWLNCDDYLLPGALAKVADFIKAHPEADVAHGDCVYVKEDKTPIRRKYDTPVDEWDFLFVGCCIPSTSTFYRRGIIEAGNLLDTGYRNCMDWEYYLRLTRLGYRFRYLPEALAGFRWHEESTTQKHWQRMIDEGLKAQREHIDARNLPAVLKNAGVLKLLRKVFQIRRVAKRVLAHGRVR